MSADTFSTNETHFKFQWPKGITGLERIALTAKGDLQRTLSAYFGHPITVVKLWDTPVYLPLDCASVSRPIIQTRRVHLMCRGQLVCVCTSKITITDPRAARLFLEEKFAIGQMFRQLQCAPDFALLDVGFEPTDVFGKEELWRRYTLSTEGFHCEIKEEFPDRCMFVNESWINGAEDEDTPNIRTPADIEQSAYPEPISRMKEMTWPAKSGVEIERPGDAVPPPLVY